MRFSEFIAETEKGQFFGHSLKGARKANEKAGDVGAQVGMKPASDKRPDSHIKVRHKRQEVQNLG